MEIQWFARLGQQENRAQDAQKGRPARPQRAKRRRHTLRYVELLSEARTPLADFFSILLGSVALRGVAGTSEKLGCWGVYAIGGMGEARPKNLFHSQPPFIRPKWPIYEGFSPFWVGQMPYDLMACADGRAALGQFDPIQAPAPRRPWLSCVGESGSLCEDDLGVERRRREACQAP